MKKEFLKIGIAGILLLAIAIPLSLYRQKKFDKIELDEKNKKFITIDLSKIQRIQIINKHGDVVLDRRKKDASGKFEDEFESRTFEYKNAPQWIVTKPTRGLADPNLLEGFMIQIKDMVSQKTIQETQDKKKDYDLDPPALSLRFFDENISEPKLILNMGSENFDSTAYYFSTSDKPGIYLGERVLQPYIDQDTDRWYEKRVMGIPNAGQLERFTVQLPKGSKGSFDVTRDQGGWILGPVSEKLSADTQAVDDFAALVDNIHAIDIFSDSSVAKSGKILGSVSLKFKSQQEPVTYHVISNPKDNNMAYFQRSDMKSIFAIGNNADLLPSFDHFVNKKLVTYSLDQLSQFKVVRPSTVVEIKKEDNAWKINKPYVDEANPRRLDSIMKALFELKPKNYLPKKVLNQKDMKLGFEYVSNGEIKSAGAVTFYQEGTNYFARADGSTKSRVFSISQIPPELYEHLSHMRNDDLVPVSNEHVKRIVFARGKARVEIEQNPKKQQWFVKLLEGVPSTVNLKWKEELTAEELFNRVTEMYIVNFVNNPDPKAKYETATLEIYTDQDIQYSWNFGDKKGELINVYSPDRKIVGTMPWVKYQELETFLDEPAKSGK